MNNLKLPSIIMSYQLCNELCTCLSVRRIEIKYCQSSSLYCMEDEKLSTVHRKKQSEKKGKKYVFMCDGIWVKALGLAEASRATPEYFESLCSKSLM